MREFFIVIFAMTAGFTASGIVANSYRLAVKGKPDTNGGRAVYFAIMVIAGPNVLFENAAKATREKSVPRIAMWLAAAVCGYWSFAIGLFVLDIALALHR
jgi:hypothetical protein